MIFSLASKCQDFKVEMSFFQPLSVMKLKTSKFKVLAFCCQWKYHYQIQITRSLYHKNQILKCYWEWLSSLPHSRPPDDRHFTSWKGRTAYTFATECTSQIAMLNMTYLFKIWKYSLETNFLRSNKEIFNIQLCYYVYVTVTYQVIHHKFDKTKLLGHHSTVDALYEKVILSSLS